MKTTTVKSEVMFVWDLLAQLRAGRLRVPRFQRPFVWNHEKIRRLLDSIQRGYPIGSVFVWETSQRFANLESVGPAKVETDLPEEPAPVGYLLDGHQRLATLMGALAASEKELSEWKDGRFRVSYDLVKREFEHTRGQSANLFPLWRLMDTSSFLDQCELIRRENSRDAPEWIKTAKGLAQTFQNCAVGVTRVYHTELSEAVEAFTRLNTEGRRMTPDQIFFALTYREKGFDLPAAVDAIIEDVLKPARYDDINRTILLRVVLAALERDIYETAVDWRELVTREGDEKLREVSDRCRMSLKRALEFLEHTLGASSQKALPYGLQLVLLSEFFRACPDCVRNAPKDVLSTLERWFWVSSFSGAFMVGSSARFNEAITDARKLARGEPTTIDLLVPALPQPQRFHPRAARVRAFFLFLKSLRPQRPDNGQPIENVLNEGFRDAVLIWRNDDEDLRVDLANRALLGASFDGDPLNEFRRLQNESPGFREGVLASHAISEDAWQWLLAGDATQFLDARRNELIRQELVFMDKKGIAKPRSSKPDADTGDDDI
jgi:hypothetical protein